MLSIIERLLSVYDSIPKEVQKQLPNTNEMSVGPKLRKVQAILCIEEVAGESELLCCRTKRNTNVHNTPREVKSHPT